MGGRGPDGDAPLRARNEALAADLRRRVDAGEVPEPPPRSSARKLFVVGCPRSGTTWVRNILLEHPLVVHGRESHVYEHVFEPLVRFGTADLEGWAEVLRRDDVQRARNTKVHLHHWLGRDELVDLVTRAMASPLDRDDTIAESLIAELYDGALADRDAGPESLLVDKTPSHIRYATRILRRFPEATMVEVLRDGRDVCLSMEKLAARWVPDARAGQVRRWIEAVELGMTLRADPEFTGRVLLLRYEDLHADPHAEIGRLYEFAGLPFTTGDVEQVVADTSFEALAVTGEGFNARTGTVGDWVNHFTADDEALFRRLAGDVFERAGYSY